MGTETRIEHLRVKTRGQRGIPVVQSVVEDAFRTQMSAAGPAVQRGLLVIRRIDLGAIASRRDQAEINRRLAQILRDATHQAGRIEDIQALDRPAILFPDPLTPCLTIAKAIARGAARPRSWPYRAIFGEKLFGPAEPLIAEMVARQLDAPEAGPALRAILLSLGKMLPKLASHWSPVILSRVTAELCGGAASPSTSQMTMQDAAQLASDIRHLSAQSIFQASFGQSSGHEPVTAQARRLILALLLSQDARPSTFRRIELAEMCLSQVSEVSFAGGSFATQMRVLAAVIDEWSALPQVASNDAHSGQPSFPSQMTMPNFIARSFAAATTCSQRLPGIVNWSQIAEPNRPNEVSESPLPVIATEDEPIAVSGFQATRHAGMVYLIALIERAFGAWLNQADHLSKATGQRLLHRIMARFGLHPEDPAHGFLKALGPLPEFIESPCAFYLSADMLPVVPNAIRVSRVEGHRGWRIASCGRLIIAVWKGRPSLPVRALLLKSKPRLERSPPQRFSQEALLTSCELGLRKYLLQMPKLRIDQLVRRNGELACTATHLDVSFDASVIQLNVRRWALDLSPGWCPWLWRVVTIHYDFGRHELGHRKFGPANAG